MPWEEVLKSLCFWGPGALLAGCMIYAIYKLADKFCTGFIGAQQEQAESMAKMAQSSEGLRDSIQGILAKDNKEHQDILIMLRVVIDRLERGYQK